MEALSLSLWSLQPPLCAHVPAEKVPTDTSFPSLRMYLMAWGKHFSNNFCVGLKNSEGSQLCYRDVKGQLTQ